MHKRIGILGGLTPESTVTCYQHIVRRYQQRFGNHAYPEIVLVRPEHTRIPLFDTTTLHAEEALAWAIGEQSAAAER